MTMVEAAAERLWTPYLAARAKAVVKAGPIQGC